MGPEHVGNLLIIAGIPIVFARCVIMIGYEQRTSKVWTALVPTAALLVLLVRVAITRNFDLLLPTDWLATAGWGLIDLTQLVAGLYSWWPASRWPGRRSHAADH